MLRCHGLAFWGAQLPPPHPTPLPSTPAAASRAMKALQAREGCRSNDGRDDKAGTECILEGKKPMTTLHAFEQWIIAGSCKARGQGHVQGPSRDRCKAAGVLDLRRSMQEWVEVSKCLYVPATGAYFRDLRWPSPLGARYLPTKVTIRPPPHHDLKPTARPC